MDNFYCLNCLHSFRIENKLMFYEKVFVNKNFCEIAMPSKKDDILKINQHMKSDKFPYTIYAELESLIKKTEACANNPEKSPTKNIRK